MTNFPISSAPPMHEPDQRVDRICKAHGPYKARVIPAPFETMAPLVSGCPACAAEQAAKREAAELAERERSRAATVKRLMDVSMIPQRYIGASVDGFEGDEVGQVRARKACQRFIENWPKSREQGPSVILCGRPGTGKTHLACAIGQALIHRYGARVLFLTALAAIRSIKATYHQSSDISDSDAIDRLISTDLLILDEIGVQVGSEHERMLIFEIINERYQQCRSTILISNLDRAELGEYLGERIMDRFRECGAVLAFDWESYRGGKRA